MNTCEKTTSGKIWLNFGQNTVNGCQMPEMPVLLRIKAGLLCQAGPNKAQRSANLELKPNHWPVVSAGL